MNAPTLPDMHFDTLFRADADPWRTRTRWYEARKRALTLASLPDKRYRRAFEPGCGAGELTAALSGRCERVVASDASAAAIRAARERLAAVSNATVVQARMPHDWPDDDFDLIVVSELGYYLADDQLQAMAAACKTSLGSAATLVACHWRRRAGDMRLSAEDVHRTLHADSGLHASAHYEDADLLLDVWTSDPRSVAQREGLA